MDDVGESSRPARDEGLHRWLAGQLDLLGYVAPSGGGRSVWYVSPAFEGVLGYTARELREDDAFVRIVHAEDRGIAEAALADAAGASGSARAEYRLVAKDGRVVWVRDESVLTSDDGGHPTVRGYVLDITDDRIVADALFEGRTRMRLLADQLPGVVWTTDATGGLTSILGRAAGHLQLEAGEFPGSGALQPHRRALAGEHVDFDVEWDGRAFEAHVEPFEDEGGAIAGVIGIAVDVTERREAAERLRESEERLATARKMEALGRLAGGVAHDFNNLLTSIMGNAHLLLETLEPDDPRRDEAERIKSVSERGASLVAQLLTFARRQALEPRVVDVNAVVSGMEDVLARLVPDRVRLSLSLQPDVKRVRIDPVALEQIVVNLVVNARDAMPAGGTVTIETRNADEGVLGRPVVLLVVSDTGVGMDDGTKSRIFEPFFTTKGSGGGTGLGLATVHGIVEESGGAIAVESEPGRGARFRVAFPATDAPVDDAAPTAFEPAPAPGGETILLVEDDDEVRVLSRKALERAGYTVVDARSGEEAIEAWRRRERRIDLLLTDVVLPGLDGIAVAEHLVDDGFDARIIFVSGFVGEHGQEKRLASLDAPLLRKPFSPEALTREVRAALGARAR